MKPITGLTFSFNEHGDMSISKQDWESLQDQIYSYQKEIASKKELIDSLKTLVEITDNKRDDLLEENERLQFLVTKLTKEQGD